MGLKMPLTKPYCSKRICEKITCAPGLCEAKFQKRKGRIVQCGGAGLLQQWALVLTAVCCAALLALQC